MPVLVRLVKGTTAQGHSEVLVYYSRVPAIGEMVQWGSTTEPCVVTDVLHHSLPSPCPSNAVVASLEVK